MTSAAGAPLRSGGYRPGALPQECSSGSSNNFLAMPSSRGGLTRDASAQRSTWPLVPRLRLHSVGSECRALTPQRERAASEGFDSFVAPGDIIYVKGAGQLQGIGTNGGFMGHVMLALAQPVRVDAHSLMARNLAPVWPQGAPCIWRVHTVECTRSATGLHQAEMLVHIDPRSCRMFIVGELSYDHTELSKVDVEAMQVWQSPRLLRERVHPELVQAVLDDMVEHGGQWSYATAARALVLSGSRCVSKEKGALLSEAKACWRSAPICTSVVIAFWQRYLCKFAQRFGAENWDPAQLIRKWMPLKADRTLPNTLQQVLRECHWKIRDRVPHTALV